jgi:hypothetical protein
MKSENWPAKNKERIDRRPESANTSYETYGQIMDSRRRKPACSPTTATNACSECGRRSCVRGIRVRGQHFCI